MIEKSSILAAIHPLAEPGERLLGDDWASFVDTLRSSLKQQGIEDSQSSNALLLFSFEKPFTAIASLLENLNKAKEGLSWQESYGPPPVQIVFHLERSGDMTSPLRDPTSTLWDVLKIDYPYITHTLKLEWGQLVGEKNLPPHSFGDEEGGFYPLLFADQSRVKTQRLFVFRHLPLAGQLSPCFYCGMKTHLPSTCPSKQLGIATKGIDKIGYLQFENIGAFFQDAMNNQERLNLLLSDGVTSSELRKDASLQVFVSYFDVMRVYQLRFLRHIAFSMHREWEVLVDAEPPPVRNHALHLAFDCLRVGQYSQAEELLFEESRRAGGKQFYATIGRAFLALEQDRESEMGHFLESASTMAATENEKIYISLLLSRYFELQGNVWKAEHSLDNVFSLDMECSEATYRQIQLFAAMVFGDRELHQLRFLAAEQKEYFMRAFLDPLLLPVYGLVEDMLSLLFEAKKDDAETQLVQFQVQYKELREWLEPEDEFLQSLAQESEELEKLFARNSYYDFLQVAKTSKRLITESYRLQENRLDEMTARNELAISAHEGYVSFWNSYRYQGFFREFQEILRENKEKIKEIQKLSDQVITGKTFKKISAILGEIDEFLAKLQPMVVRMGWTKIFFDGAKIFVKRLVVTEIILLLLGIISLPVLTFWLNDTAGAGFVEMLKTPWIQKQILFIITLLVAPMLALAQTLWKSSEG